MTDAEFDRQVERYVSAGIADASGLRRRLEALRRAARSAEDGDLPATIVVTVRMVGADALIEAIDRKDGKPQTVIHAEDLTQYSAREGVSVPEQNAYLLSGISKEPATRNVAPADALTTIMASGRWPLTIEEGLAVWRMHDAAIGANDGLSLAASTRGDRRVPAIWISKGRPKLGWCFAGTPHTWLATASCAARIV